MAIRRYIAVLHESSTPTPAGEPVVCALQPDGMPKPVIDYRGALYKLLGGSSADGLFDYTRDRSATDARAASRRGFSAPDDGTHPN